MTWLAKLLMAASLIEAVVAATALMVAGPRAMAAALVGSSIAFGAQLVAVVLLRPGLTAQAGDFTRRWAGGIGARLGSFAVIAGIILGLHDVLPPVWVAAGYLALLLTLLFAEMVFLK